MDTTSVPARTRLHRLGTRLRRAVLRRRRLLAAACLAIAVFAGLRAVAPPPSPSTPVLVAAHDLAAGTVLTRADLTPARFAPGTSPEGTTGYDDAVGRTLAAPMRAGEPVTDVRLVAASLLATAPAGTVALPIRVPDDDAAALLRVGDEISLLATDPRGRGTRTVATGVPVLALPAPGSNSPAEPATAGFGATSGRLIVIGATSEMSEKIADAAVQEYLSIAFSR